MFSNPTELGESQTPSQTVYLEVSTRRTDHIDHHLDHLDHDLDHLDLHQIDHDLDHLDHDLENLHHLDHLDLHQIDHDLDHLDHLGPTLPVRYAANICCAGSVQYRSKPGNMAENMQVIRPPTRQHEL